MIEPGEPVVRRELPRLQSEACELVERCAAGELSPAVALLRLLMICGDAAAARATLEGLAGQADGDAIAAMQAVLRGNPEGGALVLRILEHERRSGVELDQMKRGALVGEPERAGGTQRNTRPPAAASSPRRALA